MENDTNCIFCKIIDRRIPSKIIFEDSDFLGFNDVAPQAPTHILVVPKKHYSDIHSLNESNKDIISGLFLCAKKIADRLELDKKGYRMVINNGTGAGQTVFHLHLHILSGRRFTWPPG